MKIRGSVVSLSFILHHPPEDKKKKLFFFPVEVTDVPVAAFGSNLGLRLLFFSNAGLWGEPSIPALPYIAVVALALTHRHNLRLSVLTS